MRAVRRTLKPFLAGAAVALAGQRLLSAPRKIAPPAPDHAESTTFPACARLLTALPAAESTPVPLAA